ncbi:Lrp/AsnC family transcriptional regulator [Candidatus Woesearchaeota archaeon]|nr:Lrp/AsnC family transcriptional regulator [Candidatus Woesearchaeota archaeon]
MIKIIKLSDNEKKVLSLLIENGRSRDSDIARQLGLSIPAISKIREKLERQGVIKGYSPKIDFELIGLTYLSVVTMKVTNEWWDLVGVKNSNDYMNENPHIIMSLRNNEADMTYLQIYAFKNADDASKYFNFLQEKYYKYITIKKIYSFSINNLCKYSFNSLLKDIIYDKDTALPNWELFKKIVEGGKKSMRKYTL